MNRSWVRFPQAAQMRPPGTGWAFLYALLVACGAAWGRAALCARGRRPVGAGLLVAPPVFRAPEGPAAREARASLRSAPRLEARPCPPVPPAPSTPAAPGVLTCGWACRLIVRPGSAAAHGHRGLVPPQAPQVLCLALACRIVEPAPNFARNSLKVLSNREIRSLEFQRSGALLKVQAIELRATFLAAWSYALVMSHAIPSRGVVA